jgi:hypothetical protein
MAAATMPLMFRVRSLTKSYSARRVRFGALFNQFRSRPSSRDQAATAGCGLNRVRSSDALTSRHDELPLLAARSKNHGFHPDAGARANYGV